MIVHMHTHNTVYGLGPQNHVVPKNPCKGCAIRKSVKQLFPKQRSSPRIEKPGLFFHSDVCEPMSKASLGKACYFVLFKVDFLRYHIIYCIRHKLDVLERFKELCTLGPHQTGNQI